MKQFQENQKDMILLLKEKKMSNFVPRHMNVTGG